MSFLEELRGTQNTEVANTKKADSEQFDWMSNEGGFYNAYRQALQEAGKKPISYNDFTKKVRGFVGAMGVEDGKWTKEDFDAGNYDKRTYDEYANSLMPALFGGIDPQQLGNENIMDVFRKNGGKQITGDNAAAEAYKRLKEREDLLNVEERAKQRWSDDNTVGDVIANLWNGAWDRIGTGIGAAWTSPYQMNGQMQKDITTLRNYAKQQLTNSVDMLDNYESYIEKYRTQKAEDEKNKKAAEAEKASSTSSNSSSSSKESSDNETTGEEVTFTLTRGNDPNYRGFGQKLIDLGLATSKGLWGADGDVAFYNKQLHDQGIYGNLPIGVPIKLKKRKV